MSAVSLRVAPTSARLAQTRVLERHGDTTGQATQRECKNIDPWPDTRVTVGAVVDGRYRIGPRLGTGGMANVHEAVDLHTGSVVALKVPRPELAGCAEMTARFVAEARFSTAVRHPGLIETLGAGALPDGRPYLLMECLRGHVLALELEELRPFPLDRAFWVVREVARAVQAVHEAGIVHRDLKPSNIFIARHANADDRVKVLDFGIAFADIAHARRLTTPGVALGTPAHMPPEQVRGQPANAAFDIYALGSVLFEIVAGHPPFRHDDYRAVLRSKLERPAPRLRHFRVVPPCIDVLVARCLERDPARRPGSAREIAKALDAWLYRSPADSTAVVCPDVPRAL